MENNIIDMKNFRKGAEAGIKAATNPIAFDEEVYARNIEKCGEWAEKIGLDTTVGNIYAVCVMAVLRTMLGDEVFDAPIADENGEFSEDIMAKVQDKLLTTLGLQMKNGEVEEIHAEQTEE